jgi:hypothetical protein
VTLVPGNDFLDMSPKAQATKAKMDHGLHQIEELHSKGNNQQSEETAYRMEENTCKHTSDRELL